MKRSDFLCSVGFHGSSAVVDRQMRARYGNQSMSQLLESGLLRPAFCALVFDAQLDLTTAGYQLTTEQQQLIDQFMVQYRGVTGVSLDLDALARLYGVFRVPSEINSFLLV